MDENITRPHGNKSNILRGIVRDASGVPYTGAINVTINGTLSITVRALEQVDGGQYIQAYTVTGSTIGAVAATGEFIQPEDATNCNFKKIANGLVEIHLHDDLFSLAGVTEFDMQVSANEFKTMWFKVTIEAPDPVAAALSATLPFTPPASRTWNVKRSLAGVGSADPILKKHAEAATFYVNVSDLLGSGEVIGSVEDIAVTPQYATVGAIGRIGNNIEIDLSGGTNGTTDFIDVQFHTMDSEGNAKAHPLQCTVEMAHVA